MAPSQTNVLSFHAGKRLAKRIKQRRSRLERAGRLPVWLGEQKATVIIADDMDWQAQQLFIAQNIAVVVGAPAEAPKKLVESYLAETLQSGANACDH